MVCGRCRPTFSSALTGRGKHVRRTCRRASACRPDGFWQIAIGSAKNENIQNDEGPRMIPGPFLFSTTAGHCARRAFPPLILDWRAASFLQRVNRVNRKAGKAFFEPAGPANFHGIDFCRAAQAEMRSEEHTSELQSQFHLVCRLLLEQQKKI